MQFSLLKLFLNHSVTMKTYSFIFLKSPLEELCFTHFADTPKCWSLPDFLTQAMPFLALVAADILRSSSSFGFNLMFFSIFFKNLCWRSEGISFLRIHGIFRLSICSFIPSHLAGKSVYYPRELPTILKMVSIVILIIKTNVMY